MIGHQRLQEPHSPKTFSNLGLLGVMVFPGKAELIAITEFPLLEAHLGTLSDEPFIGAQYARAIRLNMH